VGSLGHVLWLVLGAAAGLAAGILFSRLWRERNLRGELGDALESQAYAEGLIEKSPDGIIVLDEAFTIVQINDAYTRITGRTREELIGLRPPFPGWDLAQKEKLAEYGARIARGEYGAFEHTYVRKDGTKFPALYNFGGIQTRGGKRFVFALVKDLSGQRKFEERLKESEATFRRIAETSTDAIYQLDLNGIAIYCSPALKKILGYEVEEFVGTHFRTHFLPQDLPVAQDAFVRNIAGEEIKNVAMRILNKDGRPVDIEINATPIRREGKIIGTQGVARDITERKKAEAVLRESEARLRAVIECLPFDFFLLDRGGRYTVQNTASREIWGNVIGQRPEDVATDAATLALWLDNNRRAFSGETVRGEVTFRLQGKEQWVYNIISPVYEDGEVRNILVVNVDITKRKLAERALLESEEKYRLLVENAGALVTMFDKEGKLLLCNQIAARYVNATPETAVGMSVYDMFPKDVADEHLKRYRRVIETGVAEQDERSYPTEWGLRWFRSVLEPVRSGDGRIVAVQIVSHDITELAQAERALRDRDTRLRLMISQIPAILWTVDRDLRFTSSMGAGLRALELSPGEVVGKDLYEYFGTDDPDFLPIAMHRKSLEGEATTYEAVWDHSIWETHTEPLRDEKGQTIGCLAIALDVTARKLADAELKDSRAKLKALAERLQTVREEEIAHIAREIHDEFGQALIGLKYELFFVKKRLGRCGDPAERTAVEARIKEMSKQIDTTIESVKTLATELRPKILDDLGVVGAIEYFTQTFEQRSGIRCEINQYGPMDLGSALDQKRSTAVFRIFQEILLNVRRHAKASRVWIDLRSENDWFILEVRDNGKGIPPDRLKSLEGLGILGMRERALVFGGTVTIDSEPGRGTRVEVRIPIAASGEAQ
jgi:PAS domain S-box-containing protein